MKKSGYGQNFVTDVSIYFGSANLLMLTQESKKANPFYGVCLFAVNYAIYVISKKWLQVVLMQESTTLISVINLHFSEIKASGMKSATTAIQKNPAYCISLPHKEI